jgi:hypothetical protein
VARHPGAHSAEFYRNQVEILALPDAYRICRFCGHPGAGQIDHIRQRRHGGDDHISNLAPVHGHDDRTGRSGVDYRCRTCGLACNQHFRNRSVPIESYRSRDW